jgi:energy-coupling factor transporter ATP-binding protein EcfA2
MKLRALELGQFRKFDHSVRVEGFGDGLNLLCGPNEMGKSTLMAALQAVLFERHRATGEHIRALQPRGHEAAPWVALDFEIGGERHRIEKRFLRGEHARLHLPDGRRFEGSAAEEELQRLLGFAEPGPRGITAEQLGAWNMLWAGQGKAFTQPELVERARRSLEGALGAEVGALLGTDEATGIRRSASQALRELVDGHGRAKGRHKDAIVEIETLSQERERLRQASARLAGDLQKFEAGQRRLAELLDEREETRLLEQRDQARRRRDELRALQNEIHVAEARLQLADRDHQRLQDEAKRRAGIALCIEDLERRLAEATIAEAAARRGLEESEIGALQIQHEEIEARRAVTTRRRERVLQLQGFFADVERLRHLQAQDQQAREVGERARTLRLQADAIRIDEAQIGALRTGLREHERTGAALQAVATCLRFAFEEGALERVRLDGAVPDNAAGEREVVRPLRIEIAGIGAITVTPQIAGREGLIAAHESVGRRLCRLLAEAGLDRFETAEALLYEKQRLEREADLEAQRARLLARAALPEAADPEALHVEIEARQRAALQADGSQDPGELQEQLEAAEGDIVLLDQRLREVAAALEDVRAKREPHLAAQGRASEVARRARADLDARRQEQELAERERPRAALEAAVAAAGAALEKRRQGLAKLQELAAIGNLELVESEIGRIEQAIDRRRSNAGDLREQIAGLRSSIEKDEGGGLDEQIADVARRLKLRERERAACDREIKMLRLLLETLDDAERSAKERYLQPVVDRLRPYLCGLFPDAEVRIDETLRITALRRQSTGEERFEELSDGTREQIAVLARLAFAELLADQGLPAVVVLDDALAFSDDRRLEQMFDILHHAARRLQIVVFTCRERLFENLGATRLRLCEGARDAAAAD